MIIPFDFQGDEVAEVMEAVFMQIQALAQQPTAANRVKLMSLKRFVDRMKPVVERGLVEDARRANAQMN